MPILSENRASISIHALREEGDIRSMVASLPTIISIHALREEGDYIRATLRVREADFYPRPPRGGRLAVCIQRGNAARISIHALREEGD